MNTDDPPPEPPRRPRIAVTIGDPAGVGPELALRLLADPAIDAECTPLLYGSLDVLRRAADHLGLPAPDPSRVLNLGGIDATALRPGVVDAATGAASVAYVLRAIDDALAGTVDALATGPIHKQALHAAGVPYPGHTELLAARTDARRSCMMLTADAITCSLVTAHVGLHEVPRLLTTAAILDAIELTALAMRRIRGREPRLTVCGLNPHAGEHGLFGLGEEESIIAPAVAEAARRGFLVIGPLPPDTAFLPTIRHCTDAYICMYHDQGLIPLKMLAFDTAVNVTLGLPIIRTSVDHGTALDIAWTGRASASSLKCAVRLAAKLVASR